MVVEMPGDGGTNWGQNVTSRLVQVTKPVPKQEAKCKEMEGTFDVSMPISEFEKGSTSLVLWCEVVREEIWLTPNEAKARQLKTEGDGRAVYSVKEVAKMKGLTTEEVRKIHLVKKEPGGRVEAIIATHCPKEDYPATGFSGAVLRQNEA
jgi:hypothetical protein